MNPRVKNVVALPHHKLEIEFNNGEKGVYGCSHLLEFGAFKELKDENYCKKARTLDGTVAWPHEQDICPDTLYLDSIRDGEQGEKSGPSRPRAGQHNRWAASDLLEDQQANIVPAGQAGGIEPAPLSCEQGSRKLPRLRSTFRSFTSTAGSESSTGATAFTPLSG
jgi:hypothetical protein